VPNVPLNPNNNPFVLAGPTGAGKSAFAVELADRLGGEIVCADAFQVYRGMAILTAQPGEAERAAVPHHLYGIRDPREALDAARFAAAARAACGEIQARGRLPVLVGGSGLYLEAVVSGFDPLPPVDPALRARISSMAPEDVLRELQQLDPGAVSLIDVRNPRRVARALEIVIQSGGPLAAARRRGPASPLRGCVLVRAKPELDARILRNVERMFEAGVMDEVALLGETGPTASRAISLREVREVLAGTLAVEEAIAAIAAATRRYAKRQLTWFRNRSSLRHLVISDSDPASARRALDSAAHLAAQVSAQIRASSF